MSFYLLDIFCKQIYGINIITKYQLNILSIFT